jgi:hypothetical protein
LGHPNGLLVFENQYWAVLSLTHPQKNQKPVDKSLTTSLITKSIFNNQWTLVYKNLKKGFNMENFKILS